MSQNTATPILTHDEWELIYDLLRARVAIHRDSRGRDVSMTSGQLRDAKVARAALVKVESAGAEWIRGAKAVEEEAIAHG